MRISAFGIVPRQRIVAVWSIVRLLLTQVVVWIWIVLLPAQIVRSSRRVIYRIMNRIKRIRVGKANYSTAARLEIVGTWKTRMG